MGVDETACYGCGGVSSGTDVISGQSLYLLTGAKRGPLNSPEFGILGLRFVLIRL